MAEVEIHTGHGHTDDEFGRRVGVMVGIIGIILAVVTISSHRAHTAAVIARTEANDQWSFYEAKKMREHLAEVGSSLASTLAADPEAPRVKALVRRLDGDYHRYASDTQQLQEEARDKERQSGHEEQRALWLDVGEGFLELGLVMSSLYFLSKQKLFPLVGGVAAIIGLGLGAAGLLAGGASDLDHWLRLAP